jgi:manganese transport protein
MGQEHFARASNPGLAGSLPDVNATVAVPRAPGFWRRLLAFGGPAYLISVGYMDPGNWATDIEGGSRFAYSLVWVLLMSNAMAVLLQALSARLGIVTGRDLAQLCRDHYGRRVGLALWGLAEVAIAACDLAEVLGSAIALHLLFGVKLAVGVLLTGLDVLLLLAIQRFGVRKMEALILALIGMIGACYVFELFHARPDWRAILGGFRPRIVGPGALYVAIGILGATVMPHNLYLHSALVQTRRIERTREGMRQANWFNFLDSAIALNCAFFVNAAILVLAAATFYGTEVVTRFERAHELLAPLLGTSLASLAFAIGLLASGQASTITGTFAGQVVMEGFLHLRMRPWLRRLITRSAAIVPALATILALGDGRAEELLVLSQVVLSLQLSFAVFPLVQFTSSRRIMGEFANGALLKAGAWIVALAILGLNGWLVYDEVFVKWLAPPGPPLALAAAVIAAIAATALLLGYVAVFPLFGEPRAAALPEPEAPPLPLEPGRAYRSIAVALGVDPSDKAVLEHALSLARKYGARLLLVHVAEGMGPRLFAAEADNAETRGDARYLDDARAEVERAGVPAAARLLYGDPPKELARLMAEEPFDLLVMGAHGHSIIGDVLLGSTVEPVRHHVQVPVLVVREAK